MLSPQLGRWFGVAVRGVALMGKVYYWYLFPGGLPLCMLSLPYDADGLQPHGTKSPNTPHFLL